MANQITTEFGVQMDIPTQTISFSDLPRSGAVVERARYVGDYSGYDVSYIYVRVGSTSYRLAGLPSGLYQWDRGSSRLGFRQHLFQELKGSGKFLRGFFENLSIG